MEVDNVVEGSFVRECVCVWDRQRESLPPASNSAVLFCPAAPERMSFRLICPLLRRCVAEATASITAADAWCYSAAFDIDNRETWSGSPETGGLLSPKFLKTEKEHC